MDDRLSGRQALSSGLWASCILCRPVGGLRHPLPGDKRPLLLPGSGGECSKSSLRTTESSLGSARQPHPPCSAPGPEGTFSDCALGCSQPTGMGNGAAGGSQEMQAEQQAARKGTGPPTGAQLPEKGLFLQELWGLGCWKGNERQWWPVHLPPSPLLGASGPQHLQGPPRPSTVRVSPARPSPSDLQAHSRPRRTTPAGEGGQLSRLPLPSHTRERREEVGKILQGLGKVPRGGGEGAPQSPAQAEPKGCCPSLSQQENDRLLVGEGFEGPGVGEGGVP